MIHIKFMSTVLPMIDNRKNMVKEVNNIDVIENNFSKH